MPNFSECDQGKQDNWSVSKKLLEQEKNEEEKELRVELIASCNFKLDTMNLAVELRVHSKTVHHVT